MGFRPKWDSMFYSFGQHMYYTGFDTMRENQKKEDDVGTER